MPPSLCYSEVCTTSMFSVWWSYLSVIVTFYNMAPNYLLTFISTMIPKCPSLLTPFFMICPDSPSLFSSLEQLFNFWGPAASSLGLQSSPCHFTPTPAVSPGPQHRPLSWDLSQPNLNMGTQLEQRSSHFYGASDGKYFRLSGPYLISVAFFSLHFNNVKIILSS